MAFTSSSLQSWKQRYPELTDILNLIPTLWLNPKVKELDSISTMPVTKQDIYDAADLFERFAPFLEAAFPALQQTNGIIESPLKPINNMKAALHRYYNTEINGNLYLKCDNELPVVGSIKARGGFYEVLHYAETLAIEHGLLQKGDSYEAFTSEEFKQFFQNYSIGVGSTGNLGLSIGIMSAELGFNVTVYMSKDAKQWKKDLLRKNGAQVEEFSGDFNEAVSIGREKTTTHANGYFVDDESSKHLFLGYSVAALRLQKQIEAANIPVDKNHPLYVYLPCGVGGSPGGITFGLKQVFGDHVHCFFVEPTHSPAVLIGLLTGEKDNVSVQDFGIDNITEADGLAVGRASQFATSISEHLISGIYTIKDNDLFQLLSMLVDAEEIFLEPSATAGLLGPKSVLQSSYQNTHHIDSGNITHIAWATGGSLVPDRERQELYKKGKEILQSN
ncbi:D-serine ammonia-lyase [Oceanobacillus halotolerans]|uniref:D-serine ammonia-lyase n=1 Tax=Oceanobacillus halotolerans TaxID=2663380 RepID=UPI0013DCC88B|nr:D-serine ammonia-lyase [Oceanobacillus halotolerans]